MTRFAPANLDELRDAVGEGLAADEAFELVAGGSKRGLGRPLQLPNTLDLSRLGGVRDYQPSELVLTAGAATPMAQVERLLREHGQMLAFEPPDWRNLLGGGGEPTLGGVLACNLSGPRRFKAGAARDHFLGFRGVSGRGEIFKAGGKVVKNVTGYDLCKLMAGSYGTLTALEEVTLKVLPLPETGATVLLPRVAARDAVVLMAAALGSPHDVSGAAYLPAGLLPGIDGVALRIEGPEPSVVFRRDRLVEEIAAGGEVEVLGDDASDALWRAVRDVEPLADLADRVVWRISIAPMRGAAVAAEIAGRADAVWFLDAGGGLLWISIGGQDDGGAAIVRAAVRAGGTGHATLIKAAPELRRTIAVFEPQATPLAALASRVKDGFDPRHIFNPGRMVAET